MGITFDENDNSIHKKKLPSQDLPEGMSDKASSFLFYRPSLIHSFDNPKEITIFSHTFLFTSKKILV